MKTQKEILQKLGIKQLNAMQNKAYASIQNNDEVILLSPTGSGKTLAFLLPLLDLIDPKLRQVQVLVVVPARELALQIGQVIRDMGAGLKANVFYGGRGVNKDMEDLVHVPSILVGTPGRIADHLRRKSFSTDSLRILVVDEYDKGLEVGFEKEMNEIISLLPRLKKKVLTSATKQEELPPFINFNAPTVLNFLDDHKSKLQIKGINSPNRDKLETLNKALHHLGNKPGIVFCNFKDSIKRVSDFLHQQGIPHGTFHGGMEQIERERALVKFRNGTYKLLLATDLAARGLDIQELKFIIHYHLPTSIQEFTHRNGRTARMDAEGTAYALKWEEESFPFFIGDLPEEILTTKQESFKSKWRTLFISGGRRDKISKGDIAGFLFKQVGLDKEHVGIIELKQECAFVAIRSHKLSECVQKMNNKHLKKRKLRVYEV